MKRGSVRRAAWWLVLVVLVTVLICAAGCGSGEAAAAALDAAVQATVTAVAAAEEATLAAAVTDTPQPTATAMPTFTPTATPTSTPTPAPVTQVLVSPSGAFEITCPISWEVTEQTDTNLWGLTDEGTFSVMLRQSQGERLCGSPEGRLELMSDTVEQLVIEESGAEATVLWEEVLPTESRTVDELLSAGVLSGDRAEGVVHCCMATMGDYDLLLMQKVYDRKDLSARERAELLDIACGAHIDLALAAAAVPTPEPTPVPTAVPTALPVPQVAAPSSGAFGLTLPPGWEASESGPGTLTVWSDEVAAEFCVIDIEFAYDWGVSSDRMPWMLFEAIEHMFADKGIPCYRQEDPAVVWLGDTELWDIGLKLDDGVVQVYAGCYGRPLDRGPVLVAMCVYGEDEILQDVRQDVLNMLVGATYDLDVINALLSE